MRGGQAFGKADQRPRTDHVDEVQLAELQVHVVAGRERGQAELELLQAGDVRGCRAGA